MVTALTKYPFRTNNRLVDASSAGLWIDSQQQVEKVRTDQLAASTIILATTRYQTLVDAGVVLPTVHSAPLMTQKMQRIVRQ